jgi:protein-S-isoprenylcysteine O-methyltransferase Ste14
MTVSNEVTSEEKSGVSDEESLLTHRGSAHKEIRRVVVWYCLLQAVAVAVWWVSLFLFPCTKFQYWPETLGESALDILMWSDLFTYTVLGVGVAWLAHRRSKMMRLGLWTMLGGITYATILSLTASISTGEGVLGATLMGMSWIGFLHLVTAEYFSKREHLFSVFRNATDRSPKRNLFVTGLQLLVFWPLILGMFPWLLTKLQLATSIPFYQATWTIALGVLTFAVTSIVNLHTAWTMASFGAGTPFPYDKTNKLVCRGLYKWIRNPMAVTGLAQGASVGIMYGSVFVLFYVFCGGLIWQFLVRPIEEEMLAVQFGLEYRQYKSSVGLWIPKIPSKTL